MVTSSSTRRMIGGIEETSASFEARSAPRSYPTREMGVQIIEGVLSSDHIHLFVSVPPHVAISDLMQRAKGRSSYKIQMEFPEIRKRYPGRRFRARGYFCTTSGNVTDDIILSIFKATLINLPTPVGSCLVGRAEYRRLTSIARNLQAGHRHSRTSGSACPRRKS